MFKVVICHNGVINLFMLWRQHTKHIATGVNGKGRHIDKVEGLNGGAGAGGGGAPRATARGYGGVL